MVGLGQHGPVDQASQTDPASPSLPSSCARAAMTPPHRCRRSPAGSGLPGRRRRSQKTRLALLRRLVHFDLLFLASTGRPRPRSAARFPALRCGRSPPSVLVVLCVYLDLLALLDALLVRLGAGCSAEVLPVPPCRGRCRGRPAVAPPIPGRRRPFGIYPLLLLLSLLYSLPTRSCVHSTCEFLRCPNFCDGNRSLIDLVIVESLLVIRYDPFYGIAQNYASWLDGMVVT